MDANLVTSTASYAAGGQGQTTRAVQGPEFRPTRGVVRGVAQAAFAATGRVQRQTNDRWLPQFASQQGYVAFFAPACAFRRAESLHGPVAQRRADYTRGFIIQPLQQACLAALRGDNVRQKPFQARDRVAGKSDAVQARRFVYKDVFPLSGQKTGRQRRNPLRPFPLRYFYAITNTQPAGGFFHTAVAQCKAGGNNSPTAVQSGLRYKARESRVKAQVRQFRGNDIQHAADGMIKPCRYFFSSCSRSARASAASSA